MKDFSELVLREVTPEDHLLLLRLFISSRPDLDWIGNISSEQKEEFIRQLCLNHQEQLKRNYPDAEYNIILLGGQPVGRLYVNKGKTEYRILDIIMLPEYRSMGIGKKLIEDIIQEAAGAGRPVRLQATWYNDAGRRLYEKLGFRVNEDTGVYCELQWSPEL